MKVLVVIPARRDSKGVPRKNMRMLHGKPLIQWTIDEARKVFSDEVICVSSNDEDVLQLLSKLNLPVPFKRPEELSTETSGTYEVLLHALEHFETQGYEPDYLVLLQPTSPLRKAFHIKEALEIFHSQFNEIEMLVSVKETQSNPYYVLREENDLGYLVPSKVSLANRRQDLPKVWELNGAIYIMRTDVLKTKPLAQFNHVIKYVMDERCSHDIDTALDWQIAEILMQQNTAE